MLCGAAEGCAPHSAASNSHSLDAECATWQCLRPGAGCVRFHEHYEAACVGDEPRRVLSQRMLTEWVWPCRHAGGPNEGVSRQLAAGQRPGVSALQASAEHGATLELCDTRLCATGSVGILADPRDGPCGARAHRSSGGGRLPSSSRAAGSTSHLVTAQHQVRAARLPTLLLLAVLKRGASSPAPPLPCSRDSCLVNGREQTGSVNVDTIFFFNPFFFQSCS